MMSPPSGTPSAVTRYMQTVERQMNCIRRVLPLPGREVGYLRFDEMSASRRDKKRNSFTRCSAHHERAWSPRRLTGPFGTKTRLMRCKACSANDHFALSMLWDPATTTLSAAGLFDQKLLDSPQISPSCSLWADIAAAMR
jgi:hypothetical protein